METGQNYVFGSFRLSATRRELWENGVPVTLGTRAFDVLLALVRRRGELATKNELMEEVWPGTAVEENNLTTHIATLRRALGEDSAAKYILTVPGRGYRFVAPVKSLDPGAKPAPPPEPPPIAEARAETPPPQPAHNNFPLPLTSLVGRTQEVRDIVARLEQFRLVTITGAGGVGKTRLAMEAAASLSERFPDGVFLIEFAPIGDAGLVAETAARNLNLTLPPGGDAAKIITSFLKTARAALVLDNCEHLIEAVSAFALSILRSCAGVVLVATSRERLRIAGENVFQLSPLPVPPLPGEAGLDAARANPSVRLFIDRAAAAPEGFTLTAENAAAVATICRRLDGIPFAIELAVPWLRMLSPERLAAKLDDRFRVLTRGSRGSLEHHKTLAGLIDWSYNLLTDLERSALNRLAVFPASFSTEEAIAAIGPDDGDEIESLAALDALIDKSLVMINPGAGDRRYRLLETTWAYALEKLGAAGKLQALSRVARFVAEIFAEAERSWPTTPTAAWRARYQPELEILRSVLVWAFGEGGDIALGVQIVSSANWFWEELGLVAERSRWLKLARDAITDQTPPAIAGKIKLGLNFGGLIGQGLDAKELNQPLEIFRSLNEPVYLALALRQAAAVTMRPGDVADAERWLDEAESLLRPLGPSKPLCGVLDIRSTARQFANDPAGCRALLQQTLAMARSLGYQKQIEVATLNLAEQEFDEGNVAGAIKCIEVTVASCLESGNLRTLCGARTNLAGYLLAVGETDRAAVEAREALRLALVIEDEMVGLWCIEHLALVAARRHILGVAERLVQYGDAQYAKFGTDRAGVEKATREALSAFIMTSKLDFSDVAKWDFQTASETALAI